MDELPRPSRMQEKQRWTKGRLAAVSVAVLFVLLALWMLLGTSTTAQRREDEERIGESSESYPEENTVGPVVSPSGQVGKEGLPPTLADVWAWVDAEGPPHEPKGVGQTTFEVSSDCSPWVREGLVYLHSFWEYEALRAFRQAMKESPSCCIAYWGAARALAFNHGFNDAREELLEWGCSACGVEKRLWESLEEETSLSGEQKGALLRYELQQYYFLSLLPQEEEGMNRVWRMLIERYPDDLEAKLTFAMMLIDQSTNVRGQPLQPKRRQAQELLWEVMDENDSLASLHHYVIHAFEDYEPEMALDSASEVGALAPLSPHMTHMGGHIFYLVGDFHTSAERLGESLLVDKMYLHRYNVAPVLHWEYLHNAAYLVDALTMIGKMEMAVEVAEEISQPGNIIVPSGIYPLSLTATESTGSAHYFYQALRSMAHVYMHHAMWTEAGEALVGIAQELEAMPEMSRCCTDALLYVDSLVAYNRGRALAANGDMTAASEALQTLRENVDDLENYVKPYEEYVSSNHEALTVYVKVLEAWIANASPGMGLDPMRLAVDMAAALPAVEPPLMPREPLLDLGEMLISSAASASEHEAEALRANARQAYETLLEVHPDHPFALHGLASLYLEDGEDHDMGAEYYYAFLNQWRDADRVLLDRMRLPYT